MLARDVIAGGTTGLSRAVAVLDLSLVRPGLCFLAVGDSDDHTETECHEHEGGAQARMELPLTE